MRKRSHPDGLCTWHFGLDGPEVLAAISTRHGGSSGGPYAELNLAYHVGDHPSRVAENRELLCQALGVGPLTVPDQQHGRRVAVVDASLVGIGHRSDREAQERLGQVDALVTDLPGVPLAVLMADCGPVVLFDPVHRVLAVAHAGRRGAVLDVVGAAAAVMSDRFGTDPSMLRAGVGPCIGVDHYEIGEPQLAETRAALGDRFVWPTRPGHARFDLPGAIAHRLTQAGVLPQQVEMTGLDTFTHTDDLFSDRRQRPCGRSMLVAALR